MSSREAPASGWKLGHRGGGCGGCQSAFEPGADVVSALYDEGEAGFVRRDWCETCFGEKEPNRRAYSWWRAPVPEPDTSKATFDLDVAREFLLRLLREDDPERASLRYLLVLLLMRKRITRVVEEFHDERGDVMVVRVIPGDESWEIVAAELDEAETEAVREQLGRLFDLG